jgi:molybdopterin-synthase adenylyltransferase
MVDASLDRYSRQILFNGIGKAGQQRLRASGAVLVGCGALGSVIADLLVRAGLGRLRIIDRDFVEASNLQRQTLFEESDARESLPKAAAAGRHLRSVNSDVAIEGVVADLTPKSAPDLLTGFDLILDGTDNFESRLLINDFAVKKAIPWIYSAVVAAHGVTLPIFPPKTPCLACLLESGEESQALGAPSPQNDETCDTIGVIAPAAAAIASLAAAQAIKHLAGKSDAAQARLVSVDVWEPRQSAIQVARNPDCLCCVRREFRYLEGAAVPHVTMCGRNSVQIHERFRRIDLPQLGERLGHVATDVRHNEFLLRFHVEPYDVTVFSDGRAIIKGTQDPAVARSLYSRYLSA